MQALADRYDLIIIDCPPLLVVSDSMLIARLVDSIVYIIEWKRTARDAVQNALKGFDTNLESSRA